MKKKTLRVFLTLVRAACSLVTFRYINECVDDATVACVPGSTCLKTYGSYVLTASAGEKRVLSL